MVKYLDLTGLQLYDEKIKEYIQDNIPEISDSAQSIINAYDPTKITKIAVCTQEEYDQIETKEVDCLYFISDDDTYEELAQKVDSVQYENGVESGDGKAFTQTVEDTTTNIVTIAQLKSDMQLNNVTNNKQLKALSTASVSGDILTFDGTDGATVADSGVKINDLQPKLVGTETTGQNIKTINGSSILGSGNVNLQTPLTAQTAYTAQGSATKVPQISTNSLGQVTSISEVTITQPTVNDGTLTIQKNGTTVATFTANDSGTKTANITVPTADSGLSNDRYVRFDVDTQNLSSAQQGYARTNIGLGNVANKTLETSINTSSTAKDDSYTTIGAIKTFVNSSISTNASFFRGNFDNYQTAQESGNTTLLGVQWQTTDPSQPYYVTNNDYAYVNDDETHNHEGWKYVYVNGTGWEPQLKVNDTPLTASQLAAINSGITVSIVNSLDLDNRLLLGTTQTSAGNIVEWTTFQFVVVEEESGQQTERTVTLVLPCQIPSNQNKS